MCGEPLPLPAGEHLVSLPDEKQSPKLITLDEPVWTTPQSHAGLIWFISDTGVLYSLASRGERPAALTVLGAEFGRSSWLITRDKSGGQDADAIVVASPKSAVMVDMATGEKRTLYACRDGEALVVDTSKVHVGLAEAGDSFYFMGSLSGQPALARVGRDGTSDFFALKEADEAIGPVVLDQYVLAFSKKWVYSLHQGNVKRAQWYGGFDPDMRFEVTRARTFKPPFGQLPFFRTRHGVMVLGTRAGRPALALVSGIAEDGPNTSLWPVDREEGFFAVAPGGQVLVLNRAGVHTFEQGQLVLLRRDALAVPMTAPYHDGTTTVLTVGGSTSGRHIRMYGGSGYPEDFALAPYDDYCQGMAFLPCSGDLVHAYCTDDMKARFLVWRTQ